MAKCEACGATIGLFGKKKVKLYDEIICSDCLHKWGFTEGDIKTDRYKYSGWRFLSHGKEYCEAKINRKQWEKEHHREKRFRLELNEDENGKDLQKIAAKILRDTEDGDYGGYTNKDIKEDGYYNDRYYQYSAKAYPCELRQEGDTVKIYYEGYNFGELPEMLPFIEEHPNCSADIMILGGKYKYLDTDEDGKDVVLTDKSDYFATIQLNWFE